MGRLARHPITGRLQRFASGPLERWIATTPCDECEHQLTIGISPNLNNVVESCGSGPTINRLVLRNATDPTKSGPCVDPCSNQTAIFGQAIPYVLCENYWCTKVVLSNNVSGPICYPPQVTCTTLTVGTDLGDELDLQPCGGPSGQNPGCASWYQVTIGRTCTCDEWVLRLDTFFYFSHAGDTSTDPCDLAGNIYCLCDHIFYTQIWTAPAAPCLPNRSVDDWTVSYYRYESLERCVITDSFEWILPASGSGFINEYTGPILAGSYFPFQLVDLGTGEVSGGGHNIFLCDDGESSTTYCCTGSGSDSGPGPCSDCTTVPDGTTETIEGDVSGLEAQGFPSGADGTHTYNRIDDTCQYFATWTDSGSNVWGSTVACNDEDGNYVGGVGLDEGFATGFPMGQSINCCVPCGLTGTVTLSGIPITLTMQGCA